MAVLVALSALGAARSPGQSIDDLKIQVHGFATQGLVYSNCDEWDTLDSDSGSAAWMDAVVNLSAQPEPKLRVGIQARYYLLGNHGDQVVLDWAEVDYKANERFGFRVGDVKTPVGLLNETQDIDPAHLWVLLPQSVYPLASRDALLDHYGGVVYGSLPLGERFGTLEYRGFAGQRVIDSNDGYFDVVRSEGIVLPNGLTGPTFGGTLRWNAPLEGLMFGASESAGNLSGEINEGSLQGNLRGTQFRHLFYFGKLERNKWMIAGEYSRELLNATVQNPVRPSNEATDRRAFYGMASYRLASKLTGGLYYSSYIDRKAAYTAFRYQKDWAVAARYDFTPYLYAKAEQHFIDGLGVGFIPSSNPDQRPSLRMTMLKLGVTF